MKKVIYSIFTLTLLICSSCSDVLDRPEKNKTEDKKYWKNETNIDLYAYDYYEVYFPGYSRSYTTDYTPLRGYNFADDFTSAGKQEVFDNSVPNSLGSISLSYSGQWRSKYVGPSWNYAWIKKSNIFIDRLDNYAKENITEEAYKHWMGVAKFFRGYEYHKLTSVFGDILFYKKDFDNNNFAEMWKDRSPREEVMEQAYEDLRYAFENIRLDDGGNLRLNRYIAAGFISRIMLFEGTWQKYHKANDELAKKYLTFAKEAAQYVIDSGKYKITGDFKSLFASQDLKGHEGILMYRHYALDKGITHHIASYSNGYDQQTASANLSLAKSFLCNDGKTYSNTTVADGEKLDIQSIIKTRDPRFEASFLDHPKVQSSTLLYASKFIDREGPTYWNSGNIPPQYSSNTNTNDAPVLRYAEVLLNWIEAKAELATLGEASITQGDIDISINAIRNRDLDKVAISKGVQKTAPMQLADITDNFDPERDTTVSPIIWEIRRERRMEFVFEYSRYQDLRRWKKLDYMDNFKNRDTMLGLWIDMKKEAPEILEVNKTQVRKKDYTLVTYDGTNADDMVGFYVPSSIIERDQFDDRVYLSPVGKAQVDQYASKGAKLTQTPGW